MDLQHYWERDDIEELKEIIIPNWSKEQIKSNIEYLRINDFPEKVFEIGAGIGRLLKYLRKNMNKQIRGCDYSKSMVEKSQEYLGQGIELCDGRGKINEPDCFYDLVFSLITFQHIKDINIIKRYCKETYRILKKGGRFTFQILNEDFDNSKTHLMFKHPLKDFTDCLNELDFNDIWFEKKGYYYLITAKK